MTPVKPFPTYKWRWLSTEPTEGLLVPPVFLGVLRALSRHEDQAPSDSGLAADLEMVQRDTSTDVTLARTPARNLIRNSGQYWKGMGLLLPARGRIRLSELGQKVSSGAVTQSEFAAIMVQQTVLPNEWTYSKQECERWREAGLKIRPLALILEIVEILRGFAPDFGYLTPFELIRICIPLSGVKASANQIAEAVASVRRGQLDVSDWPDCTPESNDRRLAKEFLLFLANFGACRRIEGATSLEDRYLPDESYNLKLFAEPERSVFAQQGSHAGEIIEAVRHSPLPSLIERQRTRISVLSRPGQSAFRESVLSASNNRCCLTGDSIGVILEAAHLIPVASGGADRQDNGICLRVDIHRLFDNQHLRIGTTGEVSFSESLRKSVNYTSLPRRIEVPAFINPANLRWREQYC